MKKDVIENALGQIEDSYWTEAVEYETKKKEFRRKAVSVGMRRVAAVLVAVLGIGTLSTYAYEKVLKDTKFFHGLAYTGGGDLETMESSEGFTIEDPEYVVSEIVTGDEATGWIEKKVEKDKNAAGIGAAGTQTTYTYASYDDAIEGSGMKKLFEDLPGKPTLVTVVDKNIHHEDMDFHLINLDSLYSYEDGMFCIMQRDLKDIAVASDPFYFATVSNTENVRKYTNGKGVTFTLVDGTANLTVEGFSVAQETKLTSVLICSEEVMSEIQFWGLNDKVIQRVLDCFFVP